MDWTIFRPGELQVAVFENPLFLVTPIIPYGGKVMIHGPKTAGKTQLALTLGVAVATGGVFLGEYPCTQGTVVFLEADMTKQTLQSRVAAATETLPIWFVHTEPFDVVQLAAAPQKPAAVQEVQAAAPALLIIDTLRKVHNRDEIDSLTPLLVYSAWQRLFPTATLLFIHHDRKKPRDPHAALHIEEAGRGTGAWTDDIDTGLYMSRERVTKTGEHIVTVGFSKCRTTEESPPIVLRMDERSLLLTPHKPTARQQLHAWLVEHPQADLEQARLWLIGARICGRTLSYQLVSEAKSVRPQGGGQTVESTPQVDAQSQGTK